jgi:hypothetical protein
MEPNGLLLYSQYTIASTPSQALHAISLRSILTFSPKCSIPSEFLD